MERLRQRADFLAAATGTKVPAAAFVLQARKRADEGLRALKAQDAELAKFLK